MTISQTQRLVFRIDVHLVEIIVRETRHDILSDRVNPTEHIQV